MKDLFTLECCVDSVESALIAERGGATRIELCSNLVIGGTTPTTALFETIREQSPIRIHALIRPRFGDFLYTEAEYEILLKEVRLFQELGAEGVVVGCLTKYGELDFERMKKLREEAKDMSLTLHRAFDVCANAKKTLKQAQDLGINTILSSGQKKSALEGIDLLRELDEESEEVTIMAGAKITPEVIKRFLEQTEISAYHMSGNQILQSQMEYRNVDVSMGSESFSEYEIYQTNEEIIGQARTILDEYSQ